MDRLTGIQIFARAVETGSFSKAARDLNLTQPTVTKHVASLERKLGARLLNRNTRGIIRRVSKPKVGYLVAAVLRGISVEQKPPSGA